MQSPISQTELATIDRLATPADNDLEDLASVKRWHQLATCSSPEARKRIPLKTAEMYCVLPLTVYPTNGGADVITIAVGHELSAAQLKELRFIAEAEIESELFAPQTIKRAILSAYKGGLNSVILKAREAEGEVAKSSRRSEAVSSLTSIEPVPALLESIINQALSRGASDIHIEPAIHNSTRVRLRVDGTLIELEEIRLSAALRESLSRRVKILCGLDLTQTRRVLEGGFTFTSSGIQIRLRISIIPGVFGEKIALRLLDDGLFSRLKQNAKPGMLFNVLGMSAEQANSLRGYLGLQSGVILVAGPTGSGKSTLLHASLLELDSVSCNIITLEDPVERMIPGINQIEISLRDGLDYPQLLPAVLRQDPDVVMVGEIREPKTAEIALQAGITGHLILSTIHAGNSLEVFIRLQELGIGPELMASALRLVIAQRLLPRNCQHCIEPCVADPRLERLFSLSRGLSLKESLGCQQCDYSGVAGRVGVFEAIPVEKKFQEALRRWGVGRGAESSGLLEAAFKCGYLPYAFGVREYLISGEIAPRTALKALGMSQIS